MSTVIHTTDGLEHAFDGEWFMRVEPSYIEMHKWTRVSPTEGRSVFKCFPLVSVKYWERHQ